MGKILTKVKAKIKGEPVATDIYVAPDNRKEPGDESGD